MLGLAALVACGSLPGGAAERAVVPGPIVEGVAWRVAVTTTPRTPPDRFVAGFPPSPRALRTDPWAWPSTSDLRRGICGSARFRDAMPPTVEWIDEIGGCTADMVDATYCGWALERFPGQPAAATMLLPACAEDPSVVRAIADPESPNAWVVALVETAGVSAVGVDRVVRAVRHDVEGGPIFGATFVLLAALARDPSPEAGSALLALHDRAGNPESRRLVGHLLWGRDDPRMRAAHDAACAEEAASWCGLDRDFDAWQVLGEHGFDLEAAAASYPGYRTALTDQLEDCARDRDATRYEIGLPSRCLAGLARSEPAAAALAVLWPGGTEDWAGLARGIREPVAARQRLLAAGFGPWPGLDATGPPVDWLVASGEARWWPTDLAYAPDWSLAELARFARLDVDTAVVTRAAAESTDAWLPRRVHLAWMDGLRFRALGSPVDDLPSFARLVGFVNALLHHRDVEERLALGTVGGERVVVRGRPAALDALTELGFAPESAPLPEGSL